MYEKTNGSRFIRHKSKDGENNKKIVSKNIIIKKKL